jgi:LPXTG-site transpeptidase (sortase) family protein
MPKLYSTAPAKPRSMSGLPWMKIGINTLIVGGLLYLGLSFYPVISVEADYYFRQMTGANAPAVATKTPPGPSTAPTPSEGPPLRQTPVNKDYSVVIDKINVNTPVVANVNPGVKKEYLEALNHGAAHALGTAMPGQKGNSYIFAHSTANLLNIEKYAAVFTLLGKLEAGDHITTFYQGKRYDYQIERKYIVDFNDVTPLTATYDEPILTLQTCDPPGTEFKRLIIKARLIGTYDK